MNGSQPELRASESAIDTGLPDTRPTKFWQRSSTRWGAAVLLVVFAVWIVLPALMSTSPLTVNVGTPLSPPSADHLFGTDQVGRDVAARVLYGAQASFIVAICSAGLAMIAGGALGAAAATGPRWIDEILMRLTDIALAFPGILLAIVLAAVIGPSIGTTIIALAVIYTPPMARVIRAVVFSEYGEDYVTAATLVGIRRIRLVTYHVGINVALPILVYFTVIMADAIIAEAALSFLGAGIRPPTPSWGNIIRDGQAVIYAGAWWISLFPGLAIVLSVLGLNRLSEALGRGLRR